MSIVFDMNPICCTTCGVLFAVHKHHHQTLVAYRANFYCPNGHINRYGEANRIDEKKELQEKVHTLEKANAELERKLKLSNDVTDDMKSIEYVERTVERKARFTNTKATEYIKSLKNKQHP